MYDVRVSHFPTSEQARAAYRAPVSVPGPGMPLWFLNGVSADEDAVRELFVALTCPPVCVGHVNDTGWHKGCEVRAALAIEFLRHTLAPLGQSTGDEFELNDSALDGDEPLPGHSVVVVNHSNHSPVDDAPDGALTHLKAEEYQALRQLCADITAGKGPNLRDLEDWLGAHPMPQSESRPLPTVELHDVRTERLWRLTLHGAPLVPFRHVGMLEPTGANVIEVAHSTNGTRHEVTFDGERPFDHANVASRWVTALPADGRPAPDGLIADLPHELIAALSRATGATLVPGVSA